MSFFDVREQQDPAQREALLMARLPAQVAHARLTAPAYAALLAGVEPAMVNSREALAALPLTRKADLAEQQQRVRPFGGYASVGWGAACRRVFSSPGGLYEPEGAERDYYRMARALHAAGFRSGELVHNAFSYHLTPAGAIMESGAHALGCTVFPAGVGQTEQQLAAIADLQPSAYVGTPSFLRILLDKATEQGMTLPFSKAFVTAEAFPASLRETFAARGIDAYEGYATADLGLIAFQSEAREGLIVDEDVIVEIVRPGTGDPVAVGEVGEVVVTSFNPVYPLLRFATGDLSAVMPGVSPCGRSNMRIRGWLGRADQTTKVKGMFVHPGQVAELLRRHPEVSRLRLVVDNPDHQDRMRLLCETARPADEALSAALALSVREVTRLRAEVELLGAGALANDGKLIDDQRSYD